MADLTTRWLGLTLANPVVASSSPLCENLDNLRRMEDAGIGAIVLHSLFEEQLAVDKEDLDHMLVQGAESSAEAQSYFPESSVYRLGPDAYLEHIRKAKAALKVPVVASLNGVSTGGWIRMAKEMAGAGADALELNIYYLPTNPDLTSADVETMYTTLVRDVVSSVPIPVTVKLSPQFSATANMAKQLAAAGAKGLTLFNRFYQPDLDIENLEVVPNLSLSSSNSLRQRLRWAAILFGRVNADLAISGGVHTVEDVVKGVMSGARVTMMTSALLMKGIGHVKTIVEGFGTWLDNHEYESVAQMCGSMSQKKVAEPAAFERANYLRVLRSGAMKWG